MAVSGSVSEPVVITRQRLTIADPAIPPSKQPYHAAQDLPVEDAAALIGRCQEASLELSKEALNRLIRDITDDGYDIEAAAVLIGSSRPLPNLAAILKSHALLHTAEGEFFRQIIVHASVPLPCTRIIERQAWARGAATFQLDEPRLKEKIARMGKRLGPPWTEDQKLAALAAWISLAEGA